MTDIDGKSRKAPALEARSLAFSYGRPVLEELSLDLFPGVVTGLIGPNGSGKTTVLRLLDGILKPARGSVRLRGRSLLAELSRKEISRQIAMVPQNGGFPSYQSVFDFAMQGRAPHLSLLGFETERDERIVRDCLEVTRLSDLAGMPAGSISGGERQRLLLARALAQQARVLLLDEFTANLDIKYQVELMHLVRRLTREQNVATLLVSHEINLVAAYCDRMILLHKGRVFKEGPVPEVVTRENLRELFDLDFLLRKSPEGVTEVVPVFPRNAQALRGPGAADGDRPR